MPFNLASLAAVSTSIETAVSFPYAELSSNDRHVLEEYAEQGTGSGDFRQSTPYTCGAMVALAISRVRTGQDPIELVTLTDDAEHTRREEYEIFGRMHNQSRWPHMWGTLPGMLAAELSTHDVSYRSFALDDRTEDAWNAFQWAFHAACAGYASALFTGGTPRHNRNLRSIRLVVGGLVPRHVVGVLPGENYTPNGLPQLNIYDPASGKIFRVPLYSLMERTKGFAPFGHWARAVWAVLPEKKMS
ncbi:hypothetical protein JTE88_06395 [Arcanobacterium phocisimile]|uniref:Peptidase C39-like domain-containing protein n=1 Tax=Arcanobacterium phocisimile TaxID=1302235 RepID=A0ABX7IF11_9ACTO|nr:hypothetical protein [Arcanobacterium phocisimile]QRV01723.1 hypothetical protein JTE88_06395 [Arcanobacterium phocisimile]